VFLLRRFLLRSGDIYYVQYSRESFSLDAMCRQLGALVAALADGGQPPVIFAVSFGAGVVLEWLRRGRLIGQSPRVSGIVFVSPVTCAADLIAPGAAKPATLLGRALKPFLEAQGDVPPATIEKARSLFLRMFEAGAQNKNALRLLMTRAEADQLRASVMATIRGITTEGARQRAQALTAMVPPIEYFSPRVLPLSAAPTLVLFAEREDNVLDGDAPVRLAFERAPRAYFPQATSRLVTGTSDTGPVQHASLVFHVFEFLPALQEFYSRVRRTALETAA
jgi:pimeloyl-ACP methyl ester carboxylesterase